MRPLFCPFRLGSAGEIGQVTRLMRHRLVPALAGIIFAQVLCSAQEVNINGSPAVPFDPRPFGKYLVQICRLTYWNQASGPSSALVPGSLACTAPPNSVPPTYPPPPVTYPGLVPSSQLTTQTITLKQVGCLPGASPCDPVYPLTLGTPFFVSATSDSGLPVTQSVLSGTVTITPQDGTGTVAYLPTGLGTIVIQATQSGDGNYAPAAPVQLILTVQAPGASSDEASCKGLIPPAPVSAQPQVDLTTIIGLVGTPTPFVVTSQGKNTVFIYSTRYPLNAGENRILQTIPANIADLAARTLDSLGGAAAKPFKVELRIPHAAALGDLASRISGLNYSQFTIQDIGTDGVRINATSQPDCATWTAFLEAVRSLEWQPTPDPFEMKLYYLSASDVATAFGTLTSNSAGGSTGGGAGGSGSGGSGNSGGGATTTPTGGGTASGGQTSGAASGNASIAVAQPPGSTISIRSDTTPCVVAGLAFGNANGCTPAASSGAVGGSAGGASSPSSAANSAAPKPPSMAPLGLPSNNGQQIIPDLLVFSDQNPGDDAQVTERKRILALLDLPRPEMVINAWVMQNSTANPSAVGAFSNAVRELVIHYNDAIEDIVLKGWGYVSERTSHPEYFNQEFYHYIADRYVADAAPASNAKGIQDAAQNYLNSHGKIADSDEARTRQFGLCPATRYCLGYNNLFQPLKPRLTDFLLTLIAAENPAQETFQAIAVAEGLPNPIRKLGACDAPEVGDRERRERCRAIWDNLGLDRDPPSPERGCVVLDYTLILGSLANPNPATNDDGHIPRVFLRCFREAVEKHLRAAGLLRAALADFLFNYKLSQQYPHEFYSYDLSQSADALNTALSPLIDAFNRDIVAFQTFMRADVQHQIERLNSNTDQRCCVKRLFGTGKPYFFNDGLVTVRTISGQATTVNTTSQSALNMSSAPTLSTLANNIANPASGASGTSPVAGVLGSAQAPASLLTGVLNSYQTTYAQIGRVLNLTVLPRSLSTASAAEINVTLNADETAGGPVYSGGPQGGTQPNMSRVANHDVVTRIRVDSVRLFEVSSFAAILQASRSKFPLLPPFVEIPYIGTLAGIPIPGAKEYHASIAVMSAMVVPTAADIADGLQFAFDQVLDNPSESCSIVKGSAGTAVSDACKYRQAVALQDLNGSPIRRFHRSLMRCFSTNMLSATASIANLASADTSACRNLSFDSAF